MAVKFRDVWDASRIAAAGVKDFATSLTSPSLRLGVTGLSRSGKTVFITSLIHALTQGHRLPLFEAFAQGRITRAYLEPQPDDDLPRFRYEDHLACLTADLPFWPESTSRISQLRITVEYEPQSFMVRNFGSGKLHIDIIDYPGEWLLDLPLMHMSYHQWSAATLAASQLGPRKALASTWHEKLAATSAATPADEHVAQGLAESFTHYLAMGRNDTVGLSSLAPGRFLMPGDLAGSPLLTFSPLVMQDDMSYAKGTLAELMERRYNSYVDKVVRPFFFDHFARLNRQIVLVDALSALNAGASAVQDLQGALTAVLSCFRMGTASIWTELFGHKIDRILFAATKADLLHHTSHDRLENILRILVGEAMTRAELHHIDVNITALAAIRATREAHVKQKGQDLPCIVGTPQAGEQVGATIFDGKTEAAIFPGDLPANSLDALEGDMVGKLKFVRFLPPSLENGDFPHIRLDRALQFLGGDYLS